MANTTITDNGNAPMIKGLDMDEVMGLLGKTRIRNGYDPKIEQFIASDEIGVDVGATWAEYQDKNSTTLYQGFLNALKKHPELKDVIMLSQQDGKLYMFHNERVALAKAKQAA